jgi:hypothetical protein
VRMRQIGQPADSIVAVVGLGHQIRPAAVGILVPRDICVLPGRVIGEIDAKSVTSAGGKVACSL